MLHTIGEAARRLGTTPRTLRYYEQLGLLGSVRDHDGAHRRYDDSALQHARRVLGLRRLGLSPAEIREVQRDPSAIARVLAAQAERVGREIDGLNDMREQLAVAIADLTRHDPSPDHIPASDDADGLDTILDLLETISMRINLTRIYTRTGDDGTTAMSGNRRVEKSEPLLEVMGDGDELLSAIGLAVAAGGSHRSELLRSVQNDLFDLGADLASAGDPDRRAPLVTADYVARLEAATDAAGAGLEPPESFVLPGSNPQSAALHHARAVCRRAERHAWVVEGVEPEARRYLNRLSDLLFVLARAAEQTAEPTWNPAEHAPA